MAEEYDIYDDDDGCPECGGEGFVYSCHQEFACVDPEGGCDLCMRRCDLCRPRKPTPDSEALRSVLAEALAADRMTGES